MARRHLLLNLLVPWWRTSMHLQFTDKVYYIAGIANKKSVAFHVAKNLQDAGAKLILSAQNEGNLSQVKKYFPETPCFIHDVENTQHLNELEANIKLHYDRIDGFLHSLAYARFDLENLAFHETKSADFLQACHISSFSLVEMTNKLKNLLSTDASIVTIGISNTSATSYGYLGPIKAMLESTTKYLAKSLSEFSKIRVNCVAAGPLKTSASAGIPNYIDNYLYSEALTLRKENLHTNEVANTICFLLSPISSGINADSIRVDAGMNANYFDQDIVRRLNL